MAWKNTSTSRGVGAAPTLTASTSSRPSIARRPREQLCVGLGDASAASSVGHRLAGLLELDLAASRPSSQARLRSRCSSPAASMRLQPGLELLPDRAARRRTRSACTAGRYATISRGFGQRRDRHRVDDRQVVVGGALGDVGARQPRDHPRAVAGSSISSSTRVDGRQQVAVRELDALRRPGRARRVDQRQQVVGLDRAPVRPRRRSRVGALDVAQPSVPSPRRPRARSRARARAARARASSGVRNGSSTIATLRAGVVDHVRDLLGRGGQVDRERRRAERHRREVGDVELGPVGEHQRDACRRAARRARARPPASASTRSRSSPQVSATSSSLRADRDAVRVVLGGEAERLGDRARADGARRVGAVVASMARTLPDAEALAGRVGRCRS